LANISVTNVNHTEFSFRVTTSSILPQIYYATLFTIDKQYIRLFLQTFFFKHAYFGVYIRFIIYICMYVNDEVYASRINMDRILFSD